MPTSFLLFPLRHVKASFNALGQHSRPPSISLGLMDKKVEYEESGVRGCQKSRVAVLCFLTAYLRLKIAAPDENEGRGSTAIAGSVRT